MKKLLLVIVLLAAGLWFGLGGKAFWDNPKAALEAFAVKHADILPLERIGKSVFDKNCASCHDNPAMHAPTRLALGKFSKETLMIAMEFGKMQAMSAHLSKQQRGLIAMYLAGTDKQSYDWVESAMCTATDESSTEATEFVSNWGLGNHNQRFASTELAGIDRNNVKTLKLAWSFAFPKVADMRSQGVILGDTLYIGDKAKKLYALDKNTGCIRRHADFVTGVRSSITLAKLSDGRNLLVFADSLASVFAVDAETFETVWQKPAKLFDKSVVTGTISYADDQLFVPISSYEVAAAGSSDYICCNTHGGVLALNANDGSEQWQWHATAPATLQGTNSEGAKLYGPSGASVWTTPTIDKKRGRLYFGTGENLSHPATNTSDAIIALELETGKLAWQFQATENDVWNAACLNDGANCPTDAGGDFDFGASVILAKNAKGDEILLAGQKSGEIFALNPDPATSEGEVLWRKRISEGTTNGGIHWGMSVSGQSLLAPVSDPERTREGYTPKPGMYSLDINTGKLLWQHAVQRNCEIADEDRPLIGLQAMRSAKTQTLEEQYACSFYYGLSSAATTTPDLVFSGGLDGVMRIFDVATGEVLWQTETAIAFDASNGISGHGGAIDVAGQMVADGWVYVMSGYSMFGQLPGNMLLAYKVE